MLEPDSIRFESALRKHRERALTLKAELSSWASSYRSETQIETVARFTQPYVLVFPELEDLKCTATRADIYPDCESSSRHSEKTLLT